MREVCPTCWGDGKVIDYGIRMNCPDCGGAGSMDEEGLWRKGELDVEEFFKNFSVYD